MFATPLTSLSRGAAATLACLYEATAAKPGNVHPGACFEDLSYADFVASAVVIGPVFDRSHEMGVGQTVLDAVRVTRAAVGTNTNLGTLLLLAPLSAVPAGQSLSKGIGAVLAGLTADDTKHVYEAIRLSQAGGLGRTERADVFSDPPPDVSLVEAMRFAAGRDSVARQYTNGFADIFEGTAEWIAEALAREMPLGEAIVRAHIRQMAQCADSLIGRKCGPQIAAEATRRAAAVLALEKQGQSAFREARNDFDRWLRADGHRRNPGTTADLVAACLFVLLREGRLHWKAW
ncbi:MAG TPA: triphosphoribosyl-dephospho-CoA synthase [Lacipirellulaceae bacterium]